MYKNHQLAYLFEIIVGLLCIVTISLIGEKGIILISIIAIRPLVLEKTTVSFEDIGKFYSIGKTSLLITFLTLLAYYISSEYLFQIHSNWKLVIQLILPYFLLNHGIAGVFYNIITKK